MMSGASLHDYKPQSPPMSPEPDTENAPASPEKRARGDSNGSTLQMKPMNGDGADNDGVENGKLEVDDDKESIQGWRLLVTMMGLNLGLFLSSLEITIVSTALVSIASDLDMFGSENWIVVTYLLTYTGFMIVWAQFSDILGRKLFIGLAYVVFVAFSGACAGAQTSTQILTFRVLQGIGGGGIYSMSFVVIPEIAGQKKMPKYTAIASAMFALSFVLGPLIGGGINNNTTWRWVFYLNIPGGCLGFALIMIGMPNGFPNHQRPGQPKPEPKKSGVNVLRRLDFVGAVLMLAVSVFFTFALQEAGTQYDWGSAIIITFLVLSGVLWLVFLAWERWVTDSKGPQEPVLTWRFLRSRAVCGLTIYAFFTGGPFTAAIIQIPQRFQAVNGASPLSAGVRLIPFSVSSPIGSIVSAIIIGKLKIKPMYALLAGSVLQLVGAACFTTLPESSHVSASQYGFQVLLGFGIGISNAVIAMATPMIVEKRDIGGGMGVTTQFRNLGGAVGLAIATNVLNNQVRPDLSGIVDSTTLQGILRSAQVIDTLPAGVQEAVRSSFAKGYNLQWKALIGLICAEFPFALLMWEKKPTT